MRRVIKHRGKKQATPEVKPPEGPSAEAAVAEKPIETPKAEVVRPEVVCPPKTDCTKVTKRYTLRGLMLGVSVGGLVVAIGAFMVYFTTTNMVAGAGGVLLGAASAIGLKYFWGKQSSIRAEYIGSVPIKQVDCLNIYRDTIAFEDYPSNGDKPKGFLWECDNDHKKYWVNISKGTKAEGLELTPFVLPDQQYYDPGVFATRVLDLPAHRRIFRRREKIGEAIKTALLVATVGILWVLILTTTGA